MPRISGNSLADHREQVRHRLFTALSVLLAERGFDAISLADIAATAGVGRTAVYNHFPDKESLLLGFIDDETTQYTASLESALADVEDPVAAMRTYIRRHIQLKRVYHLAPGPDLRSVLSPATIQRLRSHAEQVEVILRRILAEGIERGIFPEQDLDNVVSLVHACLTGRSVPGEGPDREAAIAATETFVLRAIGAR